MCTGIRLECSNGYVAGRTCEFGFILDYDALFLPVGTQCSAVISPTSTGKTWTSTHAVVGVATFSAMAIMDGVNDAGLMAGAFYFAGQAQYAEVAQADLSRALNPSELTHYILTTCETIDEALAAIAEITVVGVPVQGWGPVAPPLHYQIIDAQAGCNRTVGTQDARYASVPSGDVQDPSWSRVVSRESSDGPISWCRMAGVRRSG